MSRLWFYGAIALVLIGLGAGTVWYFLADTIAGLKAERKELHTQLERAASARKAEKVVSQRRAAVRTQRVAESAASGAKDAAALEANRPWAEQPLPQEVRDAIAE